MYSSIKIQLLITNIDIYTDPKLWSYEACYLCSIMVLKECRIDN